MTVEDIREKIEYRRDLNLSKEEIDILYNYPEDCVNYASHLEFKNIPEKILEGIKKDTQECYFFLFIIHKKNINIRNYSEFIEIIATNSLNYSQFLFKWLDYQNIPECLINRVKNSYLMKKEKIRNCVLEHERKKKLEKLLA